MNGQWFPNAREALEFLKRRIEDKEREEPRRKFVADLQFIHDRKKNEPCIPILPGHDQEAWFEKLDSNEIWEKVFEYITSPADMTSAYHSCEMFRKHVEEKRKMTMLSKALEVLRDTGRFQYSGFGQDATDEKKAESREVLKQRLVSKTWKKTVEQVFLVPLKCTPSQPIWHPKSWDWESPMVCKLHSVKDVDMALQNLKNPRTCASLLRLVEVQNECSDQDVFHSKLIQFLDIHGYAVWGLQFLQLRRCGQEAEEYNVFWNLISKLSQLKALNWDYSRPNRDADDDFVLVGRDLRAYLELRQNKFKQSCSNAQLAMSQQPFPFLPKLEFCYISCDHDVFLVAEILGKNKNLKAVQLEFCENYGCDLDTVFPFLWEEMRSLSLEYFHLEHLDDDLDFEHDLRRLRECIWPLKFLRLEGNRYWVSGCAQASELFALFNHFKDSLVEFRSRMRLIQMQDESFVMADLPKLKSHNLPSSVRWFRCVRLKLC